MPGYSARGKSASTRSFAAKRGRATPQQALRFVPKTLPAALNRNAPTTALGMRSPRNQARRDSRMPRCSAGRRTNHMRPPSLPALANRALPAQCILCIRFPPSRRRFGRGRPSWPPRSALCGRSGAYARRPMPMERRYAALFSAQAKGSSRQLSCSTTSHLAPVAAAIRPGTS